MIRSVIFDLDQTLIVSEGIWPAWRQALKEAGLGDAEAKAAYKHGIGRPTRVTAEADGRFSPEQVDQIVARYENLLGDGDPVPLPGAEATLRALKRAGIPVYLSTGTSPQILDRVLRRLGWQNLFTLALGSDQSCPKGTPHYDRIIAVSGLSRAAFLREAFVVGDGIADVAVGRQVGVAYRCGLLAPTTKATREELIAGGANLLVRNLTELASLARTARPLESRWAVNDRGRCVA